ncbi:MAG: hypothetical protein AAFN11_19785 [Chloroflexota bacterium]
MCIQSDHTHLYNLSIDILDLSDEAKRVCLRTAMTTVGDLVDFYRRGNDVLISARSSSVTLMAGEVKEKLITHGYGDYIPDDTQPES